MIKNINYKGRLASHEMEKFKFPQDKMTPPPHQEIFNLNDGVKLLVFSTGKCRLMGLKKPIDKEMYSRLPFVVNDLEIQSATVVTHVGCDLNLINLSNRLPLRERVFEPEMFPALRLTKYNPMCVNVFASGKIVILGMKELTNQNILSEIRKYIRSYLWQLKTLFFKMRQGELYSFVKRMPSFPKPPINYKIINTKSAKFQKYGKHINESEYFPLERPILHRLNHGDLLRCFSSDSGWLCVYNIPKEDVRHINSLLYQLVRMKGLTLGDVHYIREGVTGEETAEYVSYDRNSRVFNRFSVAINKTDCINGFDGRVALTIKGLRVIDDHHIFLDARVHQVKIEEEDDTKDTPSDACIFD
jgi:hypothetical protein